MENDWVDDPTFSPDNEWVDDPSFKRPPKVSQKESAIRGVAQGASLGFADEITGVLESLISDKTYKQARDESRENYKKAREDNPKSYISGELGGAVASGIALPGSSAATVGRLALTGAGIGAASGLGQSEAEDAKGLLKDTGTGALIGGVTGGVLGKLAPKAASLAARGKQATGQAAKKFAERRAAAALGAERGTINKIGEEQVRKIGRQALDEKVITPFASTDDLIARNEAVKASGGAKMEKVYSEIDNAGISDFNPQSVAQKVDSDVGGFWRSPINRGETKQLENTLEAIRMRGSGNIPLKEAQTLKQELGKVANWRNTQSITDKEQMARQAYGIVSEAIDQATEKGAKSLGQDELTETLRIGKQLYGNAKGAEKLLQNKMAREQGNKLIGLTDTIAGAGAWTAAGGPGAVAAVVSKKIIEKYGNNIAAISADKISKSLLQKPSIANMAKADPKAFRALVVDISNRISQSDKAAPKVVAEKDTPTKGPKKWQADGLRNLKESGLQVSEETAKFLESAKGKNLLITASSYKPGSKQLEKIMKQIRERSP